MTDKRSKREVVCQVVHKRSHRPTSCYVELEFTEEVDNFWGVSFPDKEESDEVPRTAEAVEAEETTEDDRSEPVAAPKTEDVAQLKDEVETLRAQLRELQEKQAAEEKKALEEREEQARRLAEAEAAARAAAEGEARAKAERVAEEARQKTLMADEETKRAAEEARKWEEESIEKERERKRADKEKKEREEAERERAEREKEEGPRPPTIGMRLPSGAPSAPVDAAPVATQAGGKDAVDPLEDLLPKPALDFSHAPKGLDPNDPYNIYKPLRKRAGLAEIVAALRCGAAADRRRGIRVVSELAAVFAPSRAGDADACRRTRRLRSRLRLRTRRRRLVTRTVAQRTHSLVETPRLRPRRVRRDSTGGG